MHKIIKYNEAQSFFRWFLTEMFIFLYSFGFITALTGLFFQQMFLKNVYLMINRFITINRVNRSSPNGYDSWLILRQ